MIKIKPIPNTKPVKVFITVTTDLKLMLDDYSDVYEDLYGVEQPIEALIPHMLQSFLDSDSEFKKIRAQKLAKSNSRKLDVTKNSSTSEPEPKQENNPVSHPQKYDDHLQNKEEKPPPSQGLLTPGFVFGPKS